MKQDNFFNRMKKQVKKFLKELRNRNTSFFVLALCICLISTAIIWKYTSDGQNNEIVKEDDNNPDSIKTNEDPYKDYVDKTIEEYQQTLEDQEKQEQIVKQNVLESFGVPLVGNITREFNINELIYYEAIEEWRTHQGIDIKPDGDLNVYSSYGGVVEKVDTSSIMGVEIVINHGNDILTLYSCLSSASVKVGDNVEKGEKIGTLGVIENIEMSEVPHLHYEIIVKDKNYDPTAYYGD